MATGTDSYEEPVSLSADEENLWPESGSHHTSCGRWTRTELKKARAVYNVDAVDADRDMIVQEGTPFARPAKPKPKPIDTTFPKVTYKRVRTLAGGAKRYLAAHPEYDEGEDIGDYTNIMVLPETQRKIAAAYEEMELNDPDAYAAYDQFATEIDQQFDFLTKDLGIKVEVVDEDPYPNVEAMMADIANNGRLKVLSTKSTGPHPYLTDEQNDKFRAVHDAFGHAAIGRGFDRHGEEAAFRSHAALFSALAQRALASETRGQNAVLIVEGDFPPQKVGLLPEAMSTVEYKRRLEQWERALLEYDELKKLKLPGAVRRLLDAAIDSDNDGRIYEGTPQERSVGKRAEPPKTPPAPAQQQMPRTPPRPAPRAQPQARAPQQPGQPPQPPRPGQPPQPQPQQRKPGAVARVAHQLRIEVDHKTKGRPTGKGTPTDPIDVKGDLDKAVKFLSKGKSVRLNQPDEVATLVDKLAAKVNEAKAKGKNAPVINLCQVTVPGTNLFCHDSKGIPRIKMPQLSGKVADDAPAAEYRKDPNDATSEADISAPFIKELEAHDVKVTPNTKMLASHLRASQAELDGAKVSILAQLSASGKLPPGTIFATSDGYVLDGHHRWAAEVAQSGDRELDVTVIDMEIGAALDWANEFAKGMGIAQASMNPQAKSVWTTAQYRRDARDADNDRIVQEGTPFARPAQPSLWVNPFEHGDDKTPEDEPRRRPHEREDDEHRRKPVTPKQRRAVADARRTVQFWFADHPGEGLAGYYDENPFGSETGDAEYDEAFNAAVTDYDREIGRQYRDRRGKPTGGGGMPPHPLAVMCAPEDSWELKRATYNPDAIDADLDRIVQEGTPFERPALLEGAARQAANQDISEQGQEESYGLADTHTKLDVIEELGKRLTPLVSKYTDQPLDFGDEANRKAIRDALGSDWLVGSKVTEPDWAQTWRENAARLAGKDPADVTDEDVARAFAALFVNQWADSSADHEPLSLAIQAMAASRFGTPLVHIDDEVRDDTEAITRTLGPLLDGYVGATYDMTQQALRKAGIDKVRVVRMIDGDQIEQGADEAILSDTTNPLSSWATRIASAKPFTMFHTKGRLVTMDVPAEQVFSTAFTGPGAMVENEVVLVGTAGDHVMLTFNDSSQSEWLAQAKAKVSVIDVDTPGLGGEDWPKRTNDILTMRELRGIIRGKPKGKAIMFNKSDEFLERLELKKRKHPAVYNPDAIDADLDRIVQEGTPYARPITPSGRDMRHLMRHPKRYQRFQEMVSRGDIQLTDPSMAVDRPVVGRIDRVLDRLEGNDRGPARPPAGGRGGTRSLGYLSEGTDEPSDPGRLRELGMRPIYDEDGNPGVTFDELTELMGIPPGERDDFREWLTTEPGETRAWQVMHDLHYRTNLSGKPAPASMAAAASGLKRAYGDRERDARARQRAIDEGPPRPLRLLAQGTDVEADPLAPDDALFTDLALDPLAGLGRRGRGRGSRDKRDIGRLKRRPVRDVDLNPGVNFDELADIMGFKGDDERDNFLYWMAEDGGNDAWYDITNKVTGRLTRDGRPRPGNVGEATPALLRAYIRARVDANKAKTPYPFPDRFDNAKGRRAAAVLSEGVDVESDPLETLKELDDELELELEADRAAISEEDILKAMGLKPVRHDPITDKLRSLGFQGNEVTIIRDNLAKLSSDDKRDKYLASWQASVKSQINPRKRFDHPFQRQAQVAALIAAGETPPPVRRGVLVRAPGAIVAAPAPLRDFTQRNQTTIGTDDFTSSPHGVGSGGIERHHHGMTGSLEMAGADEPFDPEDEADFIDGIQSDEFRKQYLAADPAKRAVMRNAVPKDPFEGIFAMGSDEPVDLTKARPGHYVSDEGYTVDAVPPAERPRLGAAWRIHTPEGREMFARNFGEAKKKIGFHQDEMVFAMEGTDADYDARLKAANDFIDATLSGAMKRAGRTGAPDAAPGVLGVSKTTRKPKATQLRTDGDPAKRAFMTRNRNGRWQLTYRQGDVVHNELVTGFDRNATDDEAITEALSRGLLPADYWIAPAGTPLASATPVAVAGAGTVPNFLPGGTPLTDVDRVPAEVMDLSVPVPKDLNEVQAAVAALQADFAAAGSGAKYFPGEPGTRGVPSDIAYQREARLRAIGAGIDALVLARPNVAKLKAQAEADKAQYIAGGYQKADRAKWWDSAGHAGRAYGEATREMLDQIRGMGPKGDMTKMDNFHPQGDATLQASLTTAVQQSAEYYPTEWLDTAHTWQVDVQSGQGLPNASGQFAGDPSTHTGVINVVDAGKVPTMVHEMGHLMESSRRGLAQAEWVFLFRRAQASGGGAHPRPRGDGPYGGLAWEDHFMDAYVGRSYIQAGTPGYRADNWEAFTRGMEWVSGRGRMMRTKDPDPDYRAFLVGALAVL